MHIFNVPWISHNDAAIHSVDIHPNGKKLATAGQDLSGAGLLIVWSIDFLHQDNLDEQHCKILTKIKHSNSVNCVRWCRSNLQRLACAGNDNVVSIYDFSGSYMSMGTLGSGSTQTKKANAVENYRCTHKLQGHTYDVLHVDWSPDNRFLASASIDNTVIVWDAQRFPDKVTILNSNNGGHSRGVKGLSWDPIGRFLATQGEDNTLKLWQTDSWECIRTIAEPFKNTASLTSFLRMDWSPDGSYLIAPAAVNNSAPTANIITRRDWTHNRDLVGFRKAISCVRASLRCFSRETEDNNESVIVSCFAIGSCDNSLAVWLIPHLRRPLIVIENFFKSSVNDLSWNNLTLAACSDNGVRILTFSESEIGEALSSSEMALLSEKIYGFLPDVFKNNSAEESIQKALFGETYIYTAWCDAFLSAERERRISSKAFGKAITDEGVERNVFRLKRKIPNDYLERILDKIKRQRRTEFSLLGRIDTKSANKENAFNTSVELPLIIEFSDERPCMLTNKCADSSSILFKPLEPRPQLYAKTVKWKFPSRITHIEVANDFHIAYAHSKALLEKVGVLSGDDKVIAKISAFENELESWSVYMPDFLLALRSNSIWTCYASLKGRFCCHSTRTGRLLISVEFHSQISWMILNGDICAVFLSDGRLIKCDLKHRKCVTKFLSSILDGKEQQFFVNFNTDGSMECLVSDLSKYVSTDSDLAMSFWDEIDNSLVLELLPKNLCPLPKSL